MRVPELAESLNIACEPPMGIIFCFRLKGMLSDVGLALRYLPLGWEHQFM